MRRIVVDFEFKIDDLGRNPPRIRCMVALDIGSGQTWTVWEDELYATPVCPFPIDADVQVICYQAKAEGRCFATLAWKPPARVVDLFVERVRLLNPAPWPSMLDTLAAYGLPGMPTEHKEAMRLLIIHGHTFTPEQRAATAYTWRDEQPELRAAWDEAIEISTDSLEQRLYELAQEGDVTAAIFMLRSRKAAIYNPNLVVRQQMLQLALAKAKAEMGAPPMIEGQITGKNGMTISTEPVTCFVLPWNARATSPHCPDFESGMDGTPTIVPVPQDGSGLTMTMPKMAMADLHAEPFNWLPASLTVDGAVVSPTAATDLWARIRAHNEWLARAYPTLVPSEPVSHVPQSGAAAVDRKDDPDETASPSDEIDYSGGFGRP